MKKIGMLLLFLAYSNRLFGGSGIISPADMLLEAPAFEMVRAEVLDGIDNQTFVELSKSKTSLDVAELEVIAIDGNVIEGIDQNGDAVKIYKEALKPKISAAKINGKIRIFPKQQ